MKQYNLVFEGAVSDGRKVEEVKSNLATIFKVDENKIDHLFTAPLAVIKKNINYDVAMQYQHALKKAGFPGPDSMPLSVIFTSAAR